MAQHSENMNLFCFFPKKAAVLTDVANDYAVGLSNFFKKTFKKIGGELVADMKYSSGDQDFTAQLTELISKKPDIVFMPAYFAEGAIIMKQARELGATFVLMGADAMDNPDTLKIGGKAVEGFLHTTFPYDVNMENMSAEAKTFTDAWKKNFPNKDPNVMPIPASASFSSRSRPSATFSNCAAAKSLLLPRLSEFLYLHPGIELELSSSTGESQ